MLNFDYLFIIAQTPIGLISLFLLLFVPALIMIGSVPFLFSSNPSVSVIGSFLSLILLAIMMIAWHTSYLNSHMFILGKDAPFYICIEDALKYILVLPFVFILVNTINPDSESFPLLKSMFFAFMVFSIFNVVNLQAVVLQAMENPKYSIGLTATNDTRQNLKAMEGIVDRPVYPVSLKIVSPAKSKNGKFTAEIGYYHSKEDKNDKVQYVTKEFIADPTKGFHLFVKVLENHNALMEKE